MNDSPFNSSRSLELPGSLSRIPWSDGVDCTFGIVSSLPLPGIELPVSGLCRLITGVRQNVRARICLFGNKPRPLPERTPSRLLPAPSSLASFGF